MAKIPRRISPLRSVIAERIKKKGATYQKAGVSSFREYSLLAEQAGIVDMGGKGGRDWIRFKAQMAQRPCRGTDNDSFIY
jgi:hypothetical protein